MKAVAAILPTSRPPPNEASPTMQWDELHRRLNDAHSEKCNKKCNNGIKTLQIFCVFIDW